MGRAADAIDPVETGGTLVSTRPVIVRRRVLWGECDPAGVVYTPRFSDYVVAARDAYLRCVLGFAEGSGAPTGLGFPLRSLSFDFRSALWPGQIFDMSVRCAAVGRHSFTLAISAARGSTDVAFTAECTTVCLDIQRRRAAMLPETMALALRAEAAASREK